MDAILMNFRFLSILILNALTFVLSILSGPNVYAQGMDGMGRMGGTCPMGAMGWGGTFLVNLLVVALIAALASITFYYFKRARLMR